MKSRGNVRNLQASPVDVRAGRLGGVGVRAVAAPREIAIVFLLFIATGCSTAQQTAPGLSLQPVVYGSDGRHEVYEESNEVIRALAHDSAVAIVPIDVVEPGPGTVRLAAVTAEDRY